MKTKTTTRLSASPPSSSLKGPAAFGASIVNDLPPVYSKRLIEGASGVTLHDGEALFRKGDAGDGCYWLQAGLLKVSVVSPEGEKRTLAILAPGGIVGELAMIDGLPRSADVHAIDECRLTFVSRAAFVDCLSENPALYAHVCSALASRLRQANDEAAAASFLPVKARIARTILRLADYLGEEPDGEHIAIRHRFSQNDIAAMAAIARESVNRTMHEWKERGIVSVPSRSTMVVHKARLQRELGGSSKMEASSPIVERAVVAE
jgi:CRP/FNR family transcriptional regulator